MWQCPRRNLPMPIKRFTPDASVLSHAFPRFILPRLTAGKGRSSVANTKHMFGARLAPEIHRLQTRGCTLAGGWSGGRQNGNVFGYEHLRKTHVPSRCEHPRKFRRDRNRYTQGSSRYVAVNFGISFTVLTFFLFYHEFYGCDSPNGQRRKLQPTSFLLLAFKRGKIVRCFNFF